MTPRPPPGGMVLPNAFGLMSMKSFKRSTSSKGATAQVRLAMHCCCPVLQRCQRMLCEQQHKQAVSDMGDPL